MYKLLPWWAWALITWGGCLLVSAVVGFLAPPDLWTLPSIREERYSGELAKYKSCDDCSLFKDQFYLTIQRKDQCEFPHFTGTVACDIAKECNVDPSKCGGIPKSKLCATATVVEPQNTWSNFAYLLAGLLILFRRLRPLGMAVGVNFCAIALTSAVYHASLKNYPQSFDVAWIYALLLSVIAYAFEAMRIRYSQRRFPSWLTIALFVMPIAFAILVALLKANGIQFDSTPATVLLLVILSLPVGLILLDRPLLLLRFLLDTPIVGPLFRWMDVINTQIFWGREWLGTGVRVAFALLIAVPAAASFILRLNDGCGNALCSPHAPIQAHASWHVLGAVALWWTLDFLGQAIANRRAAMVWLGPEPGNTVAD